MIHAVLKLLGSPVEVTIPANKYLTSKEVAAFQKITELGEKGQYSQFVIL